MCHTLLIVIILSYLLEGNNRKLQQQQQQQQSLIPLSGVGYMNQTTPLCSVMYHVYRETVYM
ncbi:uncharacterized protein DS421_1g16480 [Arachis hypogaea]|nr:uncharacterized protein DS421_1g16480 [Arachis hypogaea]